MRRQRILPTRPQNLLPGGYGGDGDIPTGKVDRLRSMIAARSARRLKLSNAEIGRLWSKHFRTRYLDPDSCQICYGILAIIKYKADLDRKGTHIESLSRALQATGVREDEFFQVKAETARGLDKFA